MRAVRARYRLALVTLGVCLTVAALAPLGGCQALWGTFAKPGALTCDPLGADPGCPGEMYCDVMTAVCMQPAPMDADLGMTADMHHDGGMNVGSDGPQLGDAMKADAIATPDGIGIADAGVVGGG